MLIGLIRPHETATITAEGHTADEVRGKLEAQVPAGWDLTDAPLSMKAGSVLITSTARMMRVDGLREIEADTMDGLTGRVPDGYKLLWVRAV